MDIDYFRPESPRFPVNLHVPALGFIWAATLIGCAVLVFGWGMGIETFNRILPSFPAMVPSTALSILIAGICTLLADRELADRGKWRPVVIAGSALIAFIVAAESFTNLGDYTHSIGEAMSFATAVAALLAATALFAQSSKSARLRLLVSRIDSVGLGVSCLPLIGYLYNSQALWGNVVYTTMALHTAAGFFMLFAGRLMLYADRNWIGMLYANETGSQMSRLILPVVIVVPIVLCAIALFATRQAIVTTDFRLSFLAFAMVAIGMFAVISVADQINALERRARKVEKELQQRDLDMVRVQRIAVLGQLVGGVAHDFNNILSVIIGNLELLEEDADITNREEYRSQALTAANHAAVLTSQLLAYGRKSRLAPKPVFLDEATVEAVKMFRRVSGTSMDVQLDLHDQGHRTSLDLVNFQQALLNILINARDAVAEGGIVTISTDLVLTAPRRQGATSAEAELPEGKYLSIAVRDTGSGMSADTLAQAVEPYFTTKGVGKGSGLGLSMAQGFCLQSGGDLHIKSTLGKGTLVTMYFPMLDQAYRDSAPTPPRSHNNRSGPAHIMIVDDEDGVIAVMAAQLRRDGYEVTTASDAAEALEKLYAGPRPDLVITDILMPGGVLGHELAVQIDHIWPDVNVLLMSGYESNSLREKYELNGKITFLQKPIGRATLREAVAKVIDGG